MMQPTWTVSELHEAVAGLLEHVFGHQTWVEGELRNVNRSRNGHVYFDLVDPGTDNDRQRPMLAVTLFAPQRFQVNQYLSRVGSVRMDDGVRVRIRGELGVYPARSTLQLRMDWIDPDYTLGVMSRERDRVLAALAADDLLDRNRSLPLAPVVMHVAVVTSVGSAAHADALNELSAAKIGLRVSVHDARTQGTEAERSLIRAIERASTSGADLILLVRGGGARTDLAAFDTEGVARAIAACTVPVWTGIGHEIDRTIADEVAHLAHKTPTAAAAAAARSLLDAAQELQMLANALPVAARGRLTRAAAQVDMVAGRSGRAATRRLAHESRDLSHLQRAIAAAPARSLARTRRELDTLSERLAPCVRRHFVAVDGELVALEQRARAHDPALALARGWSITRRVDGSAVRSADDVSPGEMLRTVLRDATLTSRVETVDRHEPTHPAPTAPPDTTAPPDPTAPPDTTPPDTAGTT